MRKFSDRVKIKVNRGHRKVNSINVMISSYVKLNAHSNTEK